MENRLPQPWLNSAVVCCIVGVFSWIIVPMVSDRKEPFDSDIGFYIGQIMMSLAVIYFSIKTRYIRMTLWCVLWFYLAQVIYAIFITSSAWLSLAMFTIIFLNIYPLLAGLIAVLFAKWRHRKKALRA